MRVVQINSVQNKGSIGRICTSISTLLTEHGFENIVLYSHSIGNSSDSYCFGLGKNYFKLQALKSRIFGNDGFNSHLATWKLLKKLDQFKPDIVHIHNIHGHSVHLGMLMKYIKKNNIKVFWTFHDVWAFTGHCALFNKCGCTKWKTECTHCPQMEGYSWFFDRSKEMFRKKKELFTSVDLTVITPSEWMRNNVKQSFLKDCDVYVIHNGIDTELFKPTKSNFKSEHGIEDKKVLLGVSYVWNDMKGYSDCLKLASMLSDDYRLVLVGVSKEQINALPSNIIGIERTHSQKELAELYTMADIFINTTYDDNYPTVNLESRACGTPVITYRTGGSPESAGTDAIVVDAGDVEGLYKAVIEMIDQNIVPTYVSNELSDISQFYRYIELYEKSKIE